MNAIDKIPEDEREEVRPDEVVEGDYVFDPHWNRWIKVAHIRRSTGGVITTRRWGTEQVKNEWTYYYYAEEDWQRGGGAREDLTVTRRSRAAMRAKLGRTGSSTKPPPPRHPNGPANGFPTEEDHRGSS